MAYEDDYEIYKELRAEGHFLEEFPRIEAKKFKKHCKKCNELFRPINKERLCRKCREKARIKAIITRNHNKMKKEAKK